MTQFAEFAKYLTACTGKTLLTPLTFLQAVDVESEDEKDARISMILSEAENRHSLPAEAFKEWFRTCSSAWAEDPAEFRRQAGISGTSAPPSAVCLADVATEPVKWAVPGLLPAGELAILGADGGTGKGLYVAQLVAALTTAKGNEFFPEVPKTPASALILSGEDDPSRVLRPRLIAAGADLERVDVLIPDSFVHSPEGGLYINSEMMTDYIKAMPAGPRLVVVDPMQSFLAPTVNIAARNEMRSAFVPFHAACRQTGAVGLTVIHTNKKGGVAGRQRLADSSDLWDMARSVLMMGRDKNTGLVYVSHEKSSYSKPRPTILLTISDTTAEGVHTAVATFSGLTDKRDADFILEPKLRQAVTKDAAKEAILAALEAAPLGSLESGRLKAAVAADLGCSADTVHKAYSDLVQERQIRKAQIRQKDGTNKWYASLE